MSMASLLKQKLTFIVLFSLIQASVSSLPLNQTYHKTHNSHNEANKYVHNTFSSAAASSSAPAPYHGGSPYYGQPPPYNEAPPTNHDFVSQFIDLQNAARAEVGVPPLVWDENVANYASWWANQRRVHGNCQLQHSSGPFGENIFWGSGKDWAPTDASNVWVEEKQWYDYRSNSCEEDEECGHYTQVVWNTSCKLGCARVSCNDGGVFMTCNYDPPGNYIGEWPY